MSDKKGIKEKWNEQSNKGKALIGIVGVCCLGIILLVGIAGILSPDASSPENTETVPSEEDAAPVAQDSATVAEQQAAEMAQSYLDSQAFSRSGLIEQLEFEGFTHEQAVYGVDQTGADWNEQAAKMAESYLDTMSFSRSGLIEQLEFEGFTHEQAVYGVESVGL